MGSLSRPYNISVVLLLTLVAALSFAAYRVATAQELLPINRTIDIDGVTIYYLSNGVVMSYGSSGIMISNGSIYPVTIIKEPDGLLIYGASQRQSISQQPIGKQPIPRAKHIPKQLTRPIQGSQRNPVPLNPQPVVAINQTKSTIPVTILPWAILVPLLAPTTLVSLTIIDERKRRCIDYEMGKLVDWLGARRPSLTPRELIREAQPWAMESVTKVVDMYESYIYNGSPIDCEEFKKAVSEAMKWRPASMKRAADP